jgi:TolB protein
MPRERTWLIATSLMLASLYAIPASGEWVHRYPKLTGLPVQLYLEGYSLPTFAHSPTDPVPSPDGQAVAVAARGWLWIMDIRSRKAKRITGGAAVDARPAWSPDGERIAFVRDSGRDTGIWMVEVASGREQLLVDTPAIDIDPVFSSDGRTVYYSSAEAGDLDIWKIDIGSRQKDRLTTAAGQELNPQPVEGGLVYAAKPGLLADRIDRLSFSDYAVTTVRDEGLSPQLRLTSSPNGSSIAFTTISSDDRTQLLLSDIEGGATIRLAERASYPLMPAWGRDGSIWFVQPGRDQRFSLFRVASSGGSIENLTPLSWDIGTATARAIVRTWRDGAPIAARLVVVDGSGHPAVPETGKTTFDGEHGKIFFYSPGEVSLELPAGEVSITASHGFDGAVTLRRTLREGETATIDVDLPAPPIDIASHGWFSGDLHNHLNYGGPYLLEPDELLLPLRAEALDLSTPLVANLQTVPTDMRHWGWQRTEPPLVRFGQEVRSHFLGHVAIIGTESPFLPSFFGPGYPVYGQLDLANSAAFGFSRSQGGMNIYVHPGLGKDPFPSNGTPNGIPLELVPDALAGDVDAFELACLWTDELAVAEIWYRLLNLGLPIAPTGGSDMMHNLHRMMAVGSTRVYAKPVGPLTASSFLGAVKSGRSFVSNGPLIDFKVEGAMPGDTVAGNRTIVFSIDAWSAAPVQNVEVLVNGRIAWRGGALTDRQVYSGSIDLPEGGWIAARVHGGASIWPLQDSYPFAHTAPIWLGARGSRDPVESRTAASELLRWMDVAEVRLAAGYGGSIPKSLRTRFADAREKLVELAR